MADEHDYLDALPAPLEDDEPLLVTAVEETGTGRPRVLSEAMTILWAIPVDDSTAITVVPVARRRKGWSIPAWVLIIVCVGVILGLPWLLPSRTTSSTFTRLLRQS